MTRLKVYNSHTNDTYYLNNVDVNCAKLYSFIGETDNNKILHKPLPHLDYSIENSGHIRYKTNVDELNRLYTRDVSQNFNGYFPIGRGIIISELIQPGSMNYIKNRIDCVDISPTTTTLWCPPVNNRARYIYEISNIQSTRVISFSYIHNMLLAPLYNSISTHRETIFMIYNNKIKSNVSEDKLFAMYPTSADSNSCDPSFYCAEAAIGACINNKSCIKQCGTQSITQQVMPCNNFKQFKKTILNIKSGYPSANELIIKSWNYNPDSSMSDRGIKQQVDGSWVAQQSNSSPWGWNDVSALSKNKNIPLLAFGIAIPDKSQPNIEKIKEYYTELSSNIEPSFNAYRRTTYTDAQSPLIPLMPYHIGLDRACLIRPDCSNPFFDLSTILNEK